MLQLDTTARYWCGYVPLHLQTIINQGNKKRDNETTLVATVAERLNRPKSVDGTEIQGTCTEGQTVNALLLATRASRPLSLLRS